MQLAIETHRGPKNPKRLQTRHANSTASLCYQAVNITQFNLARNPKFITHTNTLSETITTSHPTMSTTVGRKPSLGGDPLGCDGFNTTTTTTALSPVFENQCEFDETELSGKTLHADASIFVPSIQVEREKISERKENMKIEILKTEMLETENLDSAEIVKFMPPTRQMIAAGTVQTDQTKAINNVKEHAKKEARDNNLANPDHDDTVQLVIREQGLRKEFAGGKTVRTSATIITNFLDLQPPPQLFVYSVEMIRTVVLGQNVLVGRRADAMQLMDIVAQHVVELQPQQPNGPVEWATDGDLIWSTADLFGVQQGQLAPLARLQHNLPVALSYRNECGTQLSIQEVNIYFHRFIQIHGQSIGQLFHDLTALNVRASTPDILVRGLNAFLTKHARGQSQPFTFTNAKKGYEPPLVYDPQNGQHRNPALEPNNAGGALIRALDGFFVSSRPGIDRLLVNINSICTPFFGGQNLNTFLSSGSIARMSLNQKSNIAKGVLVSITFPVVGGWIPLSSRRRFIKKILPNNMWCHRDANGNRVAVHTCFAINSGAHRTIRPASNPPNVGGLVVEVATNMRTGNQAPPSEWYPAEVLDIVEHQPYHASLSRAAVTNMVEFARARPQTSYNRIMNGGFNMFGLNGATQNNLANFGNMSTGRQMLEIPGHWLHTPSVQYNKRRTPTDASWDMRDIMFVERNRKVHELRFMNVNPGNSGGRNSNNHQAFVTKRGWISDALSRHGILQNPQQAWVTNVPPPGNPPGSPFRVDLTRPVPTPAFENDIFTKLNDIHPQRPLESPVLVALNHKDIPMYAYIKRVADLRIGVNTIIIDQSGSKFNAPKGSNIALKYNLKLGQTNHQLAGNSFEALRKSGRARDTIVIGADVTHPSKGAAHGTPSIAAVVGSTDDNFVHYPGSMRLQRNRKEYIIELGDMVKERLIDWAERHGNGLPANVLFYRDGASESQYAKLRSYEIPQIEKAFHWAQEFLNFKASGGTHRGALDNARDPWPTISNPSPPGVDRAQGVDDEFTDSTGITNSNFKLTYVVVGKRHNTRFYPKNANDRSVSIGGANGNVKPGLVVDQVITHPLNLDFYLQSHTPIAGTGRSAHYITMQNNMDLSALELQTVVSPPHHHGHLLLLHSLTLVYNRLTTFATSTLEQPRACPTAHQRTTPTVSATAADATFSTSSPTRFPSCHRPWPIPPDSTHRCTTRQLIQLCSTSTTSRIGFATRVTTAISPFRLRVTRSLRGSMGLRAATRGTRTWIT